MIENQHLPQVQIQTSSERERITREEVSKIRRLLLAWGRKNGRSFSWRDDPTPFKVLVAEICLRRTGVRIAEPVITFLLASYPSSEDLAEAAVLELKEVFKPIGLTSRASMLVELARLLQQRHIGKVPSKYEELTALPGVGRYIANAVLCFAYRQSVPVVDGSVKRCLACLYGLPNISDRIAWQLAEQLVPRRRPDLYNYSLLDLAAMICRPNHPLCDRCPLAEMCDYYVSSLPGALAASP